MLDIKLSINTSPDCKNLLVTDLTGLYNAQSNSTGWRPSGPQNSSLALNRIVLSIIPYIKAESEEIFFRALIYPSSTDNPRWRFPKGSLENFRFSVPHGELINDIEAAYNEMQPSYELPKLNKDNVPDLLYNVNVYVVSTTDQSDVKFEKAFCFTNVCTIKKQVNKLFTEVNFECEDCDDSDLEKALLAKNLLETLEESCNL